LVGKYWKVFAIYFEVISGMNWGKARGSESGYAVNGPSRIKFEKRTSGALQLYELNRVNFSLILFLQLELRLFIYPDLKLLFMRDTTGLKKLLVTRICVGMYLRWLSWFCPLSNIGGVESGYMPSRSFLVAPVPGPQIITLIWQIGSATCYSKLFPPTKSPAAIVHSSATEESRKNNPHVNYNIIKLLLK
jgi:hypothetical protein